MFSSDRFDIIFLLNKLKENQWPQIYCTVICYYIATVININVILGKLSKLRLTS